MLRAIKHTLINRNYALFMAGSFISAMGSWFQAVAIGWLVLELSNSAFILGLANFAQMAPLFFLGFFGGVLADRVDRRLLLVCGMGIGTLATASLAALSLAGLASVPVVLLASLALGLSNAVVWPAWQPFITELVPKARMRDAIAFNSARFNLTRVVGPALAGVLMARVGAPLCLAVAALSSAGVMVATWLIRRPTGRRRVPLPWLAALSESVAYVRGDRFIAQLLLVIGLFGVLVQPYQAFLPAFARDVLGTGAEGLGVLLTAVGAGAVLGAALTGSRHVAAHPERAMALTALLSGAGLACFAAAPLLGLPAWAATLALVAVGFGSVAYLTTASATIQLRVPEHLTGRVMGLWVVMNAGTMPLGSLALGAVAEPLGLPQVILACGLVGVAIGALGLLNRGATLRAAPSLAT
ncbi:MAG TPA: MFS transporter [Chloroflexota bacterium]|nr:MFS transporter [Chloroflexota bacterium]